MNYLYQYMAATIKGGDTRPIINLLETEKKEEVRVANSVRFYTIFEFMKA